MTPDISVIIPTYNRANDLARTLEGMVRTEKKDLFIEFVVVDNNSKDQTNAVVESFSSQISIRYLFEPRQGKNCALNCALDNVELGNITVFTDDDVNPSSDWLVSIRAVCDRWPHHSVFGGRIDVVFPTEDVPEWAFDDVIRVIAFAYHNYSDRECIYKGRELPFGPNFWVRRAVLDDGLRFSEKIGPHPTNQILGDETLFLLDLLRLGYEVVYSPSVVVGHRIQPHVLTFSGICSRGYQHGRGKPHLDSLPWKTLIDKSPTVWRLGVSTAIIWNILKILKRSIFSARQHRVGNVMMAISRLAGYVEAMRLASDQQLLAPKDDFH